MNNEIRLHIPAIPYTITRDEYSHDAFTGKVKRFSPMMRSRGFEVYHYGVETSESGASKDIELMTKDEWTDLRIQTIQWLNPKLTLEEAIKENIDPTFVVSELSNWDSPLCKEFNKRLYIKIRENFRDKKTDIICLPLGRTYDYAIKELDGIKIESGIGYSGSYLNYRIFESNSWMSRTLGVENKQPNNYWFVIPNYFDTNEFKLSLIPKPLKIGYLGRLNSVKGCGIIVEIAKKFPHVDFVLCGNGDPIPFLKAPNIFYKEPIHGQERSQFLGDCTAFLHLAKYLEPFGGGAVEAQLCGTPVISSDWGAMVETVEQFKTGFRGHTLADYCYGIQMALDGKFDRNYIRERAVNLYDMNKLAYNYEYAFKSILDIHNGKNGWYSPDTYNIHLLKNKNNELLVDTIHVEPRIYIFIVYYGLFPNYFQLYLDSVGINKDILTVFLVTDIDLSIYNLPTNLIHIHIGVQDVKKRISDLLFKIYNKRVLEDELIKTNYKLVDFKIVYPLLFDDYLQKYNIKNTDYVGWGDCDLIYGKLSNFIKFDKEFEIIGGWHGHLCAIKNTDSFKNNFTAIPNYFELVTNNSKTFLTDEIAYREPLKTYLKHNNFKMFYTNNYFCDIVPECFYSKFRNDYKSYIKNFFHTYNPLINISHLYYDKIKSKLMLTYDNGKVDEVLYCHLQKRKMLLPFTIYNNGYYINQDCFSQIPLKIWQTWETNQLPPKMKENVDNLKEQHLTFEYNLVDASERYNFIKINFPECVLKAYEALIPGAYKADLWRYCVLYIHGGIYMDIKLKFCNGYNLYKLIDKDHFIRDGIYIENNKEYRSICNGFICCDKGNTELLTTIFNIVYNVSLQYYGLTPFCPTGPRLLGKYINFNNFIYSHGGIIGDSKIRNINTNENIIEFYKDYEVDRPLNDNYYINLWNNKNIYNICDIELSKVYLEINNYMQLRTKLSS